MMEARYWFAGTLVLTGIVLAQAPSWWTDRAVLRVGSGVVTNDFAPVNQGQAKWIATQAKAEFEDKLGAVGGAGAKINALVASFSPTNNYRPVNAGQLKNTVAPFYERLYELGLTNCYPPSAGVPYPWSNSTNPPRDFSMVNIGQTKYVFSFDLTDVSSAADYDSDGNGLPDWWELKYFGHIGVDPNADPDGDGLNNLLEFQKNTDPSKLDTDGDGIPDILDAKPLNPEQENPILFVVDGEGGEQGVLVQDHKQYKIPKGTAKIALTVVVFSREWPTWTCDQSQFNDIVEYSVTSASGTMAQGSYMVNNLDSQFAVGAYPGGNWAAKTQEWTDVSALTANGDAYVDITASAKNISDSALGSGAAVQIDIPKVEIAMDGNRDDNIDFDDPADAKYVFWVNDDFDVMHWEENMWHEDDDPRPGTIGPIPGAIMVPNCNDDYIGEQEYGGVLINPHCCRRDLEDFTRLHIRVDNTIASTPDITYWLKFDKISSGTPSVNIFEAIDDSLSYLQNGTVADQQIQKTRLLTVDATERQLPNAYIQTGNQRSPFILEGKTAGKGELTIIVKKAGNEIYRKAVWLELRTIDKFYQVFRVATVGQNSQEVPSSGNYNSDFTNSDDYLLFVHGFNVNATDKAYWPGTVFKRLWWQGYKGHVGFFDWPCVMFSYVDMQCYDDSEYNAWRCGAALLDRVNQLNGSGYSGKIRVLAHSQGNVVAGEALRLASGQVVHTYIATQPAIAGDHYQAGLAAYFTTYGTPNVLASYPLSSAPYLVGVSGKAGQRYNYYNFDDYALRTVGFGSWEWDNENRPNFNYGYIEVDGDVDTYAWPSECFFYDSLLPFDYRVLAFDDDRYEIYSYGAEARSRASGVLSVLTDFTSFNLQLAPLNYNSAHYSHSRQFRSNIVDERAYWNHVKADCGF